MFTSCEAKLDTAVAIASGSRRTMHRILMTAICYASLASLAYAEQPDLLGGAGFFSVKGGRGEIIGGLIYVAAPMIVVALLCRILLYGWDERRGNQLHVSPNALSAIVGVLSYFALAVLFFSSIGHAYMPVRRILSSIVLALFFTWPVLVIMGLFCLFYVGTANEGRRLPNYLVYVVCVGCALAQYFYLEQISF